MTKELYYVTKEYDITFNYHGTEISALVGVTSSSSEEWESDVRVIELKTKSYDADDVEKYIIENWDKFKEIEISHAGG